MKIESFNSFIKIFYFGNRRLLLSFKQIVCFLYQLALLGIVLQVKHRFIDELGLFNAFFLKLISFMHNFFIVFFSLFLVLAGNLRSHRGIVTLILKVHYYQLCTSIWNDSFNHFLLSCKCIWKWISIDRRENVLGFFNMLGKKFLCNYVIQNLGC